MVYLSFAEDIIRDLRNSNIVEPKYDNIQIKMALELYSKRGAEGQLSHGENGISRSYDKTDISIGLLEQVTPVIKTPYSNVRVIE